MTVDATAKQIGIIGFFLNFQRTQDTGDGGQRLVPADRSETAAAAFAIPEQRGFYPVRVIQHVQTSLPHRTQLSLVDRVRPVALNFFGPPFPGPDRNSTTSGTQGADGVVPGRDSRRIILRQIDLRDQELGRHLRNIGSEKTSPCTDRSGADKLQKIPTINLVTHLALEFRGICRFYLWQVQQSRPFTTSFFVWQSTHHGMRSGCCRVIRSMVATGP